MSSKAHREFRSNGSQIVQVGEPILSATYRDWKNTCFHTLVNYSPKKLVGSLRAKRAAAVALALPLRLTAIPIHAQSGPHNEEPTKIPLIAKNGLYYVNVTIGSMASLRHRASCGTC